MTKRNTEENGLQGTKGWKGGEPRDLHSEMRGVSVGYIGGKRGIESTTEKREKGK